MQAESDQPEQYNAVMNCIFSAQKAGIVVDSCCLGETSLFMQQAAFLTGGSYLNMQETGLLQVVCLTYSSNPCLSTLTPYSTFYLLQHLLMTFLASQNVRPLLRLPKQETTDFRAACFCHREIINMAWICSVCLSVFCKFSPVCDTCGTRAAPKVLKGRKC